MTKQNKLLVSNYNFKLSDFIIQQNKRTYFTFQGVLVFIGLLLLILVLLWLF